MTTDTALGVTKLVVDDKIPLDKIPYVVRPFILLLHFQRTQPCPQDMPTIRFNSKESVEMPFRAFILQNRSSRDLASHAISFSPCAGYIADGEEPRLPPGMRELLHEDLNKSFDF